MHNEPMTDLEREVFELVTDMYYRGFIVAAFYLTNDLKKTVTVANAFHTWQMGTTKENRDVLERVFAGHIKNIATIAREARRGHGH